MQNQDRKDVENVGRKGLKSKEYENLPNKSRNTSSD